MGVGIMPALDVNSLDHMARVIEATRDVEGIVGYKLGLSTVLRTGLAAAMRMVRELTDHPIVYDHQKIGPDMPDMAGKFYDICREAGVDGVIIFPVAGPTAVREFAGQAIKNGIVPIVGGQIPVNDYSVSGGGFMVDDALERIIDLAAAVGTTNFVLPANNPETIRSRCGQMAASVKDPIVFLTGIGPLGGKIEEAFSAASEIPHRLAIVGRLITAAENPKEAARRCFDSIMSVA
jgi:orotidine-5'-phosphate decarboxylase